MLRKENLKKLEKKKVKKISLLNKLKIKDLKAELMEKKEELQEKKREMEAYKVN